MTIQPSTPPGFYPDPYAPGVERWWDGARWSDTVRAAAPAQPVVQERVVVVQQSPRRMVTKSKRHTSHTFHLIMTILTAGLWGLFVWLPMIILNGMVREKSTTRVR